MNSMVCFNRNYFIYSDVDLFLNICWNIWFCNSNNRLIHSQCNSCRQTEDINCCYIRTIHSKDNVRCHQGISFGTVPIAALDARSALKVSRALITAAIKNIIMSHHNAHNWRVGLGSKYPNLEVSINRSKHASRSMIIEDEFYGRPRVSA